MENQINAGDQDTQQIGQNPVNQPVQTSEKPKVKYLITGMVVLACLIVLGFGGYYLGKKSLKTWPSTGENQTQPTLTPSVIPDETANWKTYKNEEYGFEFKYPPTLFTKEKLKQTGYGYLANIGISSGINPSDGQINSFDLYIMSNPKGLDLKSYFSEIEKTNQSGDPVSPFGQSDPIMKNIGSGETIYFFDEVYCVASCKEAVWLSKDKIYVYQIFDRRFSDKGETVKDNIFDQILSTFKFTDQKQTDETANWKTYTNQFWGYSLKYPDTYSLTFAKENHPPESAASITSPEKSINLLITDMSGSISGNASPGELTPVKGLLFSIAGTSYVPDESYHHNLRENIFL